MATKNKIIGKKAMIIKLTESDRLVYPELKVGMTVQIQDEHFNGGSFYVIAHDGTHLEQSGFTLGRISRDKFVVVGVDKTKSGNLIVNCGKKATYFITVCLGSNGKGRLQFMKWRSLKTVLNQCL